MARKISKNVCLYFQVHQPFRLSEFKVFDVETRKDYFKGYKGKTNKYFVNKVAKKCYLPANAIVAKLLDKYPNFKAAFSISGVALEQFGEFSPALLKSFKSLASSKRIEILGETYYHSLSSIFSEKEFAEQILLHRKIIWKLFKRKPKVFRNTELIYNNRIGQIVEEMGYKAILAEGWHKYLGKRSPNFVYESTPIRLDNDLSEKISKYSFDTPTRIKLLLKNYKLSDDIAFRFSDKSWSEYPLTAEKFASWVADSEGETINLFMDYETFGEHQWEDSGIFDFLSELPNALAKYKVGFRTPSELLTLKAHGQIDAPDLTSWADSERDVSAWLGNKMQQEAVKQVYSCERDIEFLMATPNRANDVVLEKWRKLQTSDHFYYMSTKYWNDGDIHTYFSHYESPYDAYINYMNVLQDFKLDLRKRVEALEVKNVGKELPNYR